MLEGCRIFQGAGAKLRGGASAGVWIAAFFLENLERKKTGEQGWNEKRKPPLKGHMPGLGSTAFFSVWTQPQSTKVILTRALILNIYQEL